MTDDARLDYPATNRNREPILAVLRELLPRTGEVLEIASGSGQHAAFFAAAMPGLRWQPSDIDPEVFTSIAAWSAELDNVAPPIAVDTASFATDDPAARPPWDRPPLDAIYCANMIHIAPWEACLGLLALAGRALNPDGSLVVYGPFMRGGQHTAPSNEAFDARLKTRDPRWGVRDLDVVAEIAGRHGLTLGQVVEMPANNLTVSFRNRVRDS